MQKDNENVFFPSSEDSVESNSYEDLKETQETTLEVPETAEFTTVDINEEEISLIHDIETENKDGLLNIEHFSDYTNTPKKTISPDLCFVSKISCEETITILSDENPSPVRPITKKEKYQDPDIEKYNPEKPRKVDARFDFVELFVFTLLAVILLTTFVFRHALVRGPSMQNTLYENEHLIISNLFYTPKKGDIVVCHDRETGHYDPIVKRVIATEGDTISIKDSQVYLNGEKLDEEYVFFDNENVDLYPDLPEYTVPEGMIYVMGDHRNASSDSRGFGPVREDAVLGKVILRFLPLNKFGSVN